MILAMSMLLVGALLHHVQAQFITPPTGFTEVIGYADIPVRYKEVPAGICELDPDVKSFSGYADVAENQHIFWWFFEARNGDPREAPLTVWINGGPGASSMIGLFEELGPCGVDRYGNVFNNPHSWTNVSNMLFIDQPSQVGFSYSKPVPAYRKNDELVLLPDNHCPEDVDGSTCGTFAFPNVTGTANSTLNAAPNFWKTLQGFMGAFPQYSRNGFNLATESYGGHYGPVFSAYIAVQNALDIPGTKQIQLETLLIGNGWFDPIINYQAFYNFTVFPGNTYDYVPFNETQEVTLYNNLYGPGNCLDQLKACKTTGLNDICAKADSACAANVEEPYASFIGRNEYDVRYLNPDPFPYAFSRDYLNTPKVLQAIGAYTNWSNNGAVSAAFGNTGDDAREVNTIEDIRQLLSLGTTVAIYAGDADFNCNWLGGEAVAEEVLAEGFDQAGYVNVLTSDGVVHGQVKQAGKFSFTRIYESGHMVPFYQPLIALELFGRAINGLDLETGAQLVSEGYLTKGEKTSMYREGNATVQWVVVPGNLTYNVTTNRPGQPWATRNGGIGYHVEEPTPLEVYGEYPYQS